MNPAGKKVVVVVGNLGWIHEYQSKEQSINYISFKMKGILFFGAGMKQS
jgi:hypothetical protein